MTRIRAAICEAFGEPLRIGEAELAAPGPGEVEVKIDACAVCHSDISYAEGAWGGALPAVYGHEAAGRITALGEGVRGYAEGDAVLVTLIRSCGHCPGCAEAHPVRCETRRAPGPGPLSLPDGGALEQGLDTGAFAERVVVDASQIVGLPDDIAMDAASLLACGVITGVGAVTNSAAMKPGKSAVVIGAGGVGLNAIQGAALCGASQIVAVDLSEERLKAAREFGATHGVLADTGAPWKEVRAITGGRGADYAFVTVGVPVVYAEAPRYLAPGGMLVMVGMTPAGAKVEYDPSIVAALSQSMVGSKMGDTVLARDIPWLIEMYRQGRLKLDELISRRYRLEEINEAIAEVNAGHARRNVIVFD
ncbi:zinc-binding dehydrogenase [Maritimibacter sp. 55A14]|uniref:Zn-dependent alcohol dehydrogenase n=1 Tax=Maritimibacter sp. 55A14 TaxID=2174844 RepID=UPI000D614463|nr:Zn-dependent alcohol dehydrogenase [Maritimibacter sp. 55A14]PWE32105.1 zinc-binding dehydrogenase [Maritimibacter sp. 55A14]